MESTFLSALDHPNKDVQFGAVQIIANIGSPSAVERLMQRLDQRTEQAKASGEKVQPSIELEALVSLGEPRVVEQLLCLAQDPWSAGFAAAKLERLLGKSSARINDQELRVLAQLPDLNTLSTVTDDSP